MSLPTPGAAERLDFIREIVTADNASGKHGGRVCTRFPPEPNGYLHIGHAKAICLNFGIARDFSGTCNLRFDDTNPVTEDVEYVESIMADVRWLGFDWDDRLYFASDYFEQLYNYAETLIQQRPRVRRQPLGGRDPRNARHAHRAGHEQPVPRPARRGQSRPLPPDARRRVPGRRARAAREDRHGVAQHQHARPGAVPHSPRASSPHRRHVAHLPDVRLRASDFRRARADHALALHARVRGAPPALRLAGRQPAAAGEAAADRVRASQPQLHGDEQAQAPAARRREARERLGRSAHADDFRHAAPRLHARGDSPVCRRHRRREAREHRRHRTARALRARGSQQARAARDGRAAAAQGRPRELPRGPGRGDGRRQQPGGSGRRHAQGALLRRAVHRARRLPRGSAEEVLPSGARTRSAPPQRVLSSRVRASSRTPPATSSSCDARTIRRRAAATRRTAARSRRRCTGCRPRMPSTPRSGCTIASSTSRILARATRIF